MRLSQLWPETSVSLGQPASVKLHLMETSGYWEWAVWCYVGTAGVQVSWCRCTVAGALVQVYQVGALVQVYCCACTGAGVPSGCTGAGVLLRVHWCRCTKWVHWCSRTIAGVLLWMYWCRCTRGVYFSFETLFCRSV